MDRFSQRALTEDQEKGAWKERFGVFGDLPTRFLISGLKVAPWFLEPLLVAVWTLVFFGVAGEQRRAVAANLKALFPEWGSLRCLGGAYLVFWNFAGTYVDAMRCETKTGEVDWEISGEDWAGQVEQMSDGCIILTAHMGNYDMAAPVFSEKFGRPVYAVRAPERNPEMQKIKEAELRQKERENPLFRTLYNKGGDMLGVELARLLGEGNVVAVQGDRVIFEVSPMEVEVEPGLVMGMPRGPLFLAQMSKVPVFPLFILRDGWRRYRVQLYPRLELPARRRGADADEAAKLWAKAILEAVRPNWSQWFVFEPVFRREEGGAK
ncbi:lysophospholipid acyltransferase family protein [Haloferula helveola]|uniref:lysophospholipid acyltransferase family protein n=1 Tax=Haloferula helveola TaxID=490095 RepID=UPI0030CD579B